MNRKGELEKSREIIGKYLSKLHLLEIGGLVDEKQNKLFMPEYMSGFMQSETEGILTVCACVKKNAAFIYGQNQKVTMAYSGDGKLCIFTARIVNIRETDLEDLGKINEIFNNRVKNLGKLLGPVRFVVVEALALTEPQLHQRRQYPRSMVNWDVYFKLLNPSEELKNACASWIENKVLEYDRGYFKIKTVDVSAGGFKSEIAVEIPVGAPIECVMEIKVGGFRAAGRISSKVVDCSPNKGNPKLYDMRVQFLDLGDSIKEAMEKGIT